MFSIGSLCCVHEKLESQSCTEISLPSVVIKVINSYGWAYENQPCSRTKIAKHFLCSICTATVFTTNAEFNLTEKAYRMKIFLLELEIFMNI